MDILQTYRVGNVVLYGANIDRSTSDGGFARAARLTDWLQTQRTGEPPLLIGIDVEGGEVVRFTWTSGRPPRARSAGATIATPLTTSF